MQLQPETPSIRQSVSLAHEPVVGVCRGSAGEGAGVGAGAGAGAGAGDGVPREQPAAQDSTSTMIEADEVWRITVEGTAVLSAASRRRAGHRWAAGTQGSRGIEVVSDEASRAHESTSHTASSDPLRPCALAAPQPAAELNLSRPSASCLPPRQERQPLEHPLRRRPHQRHDRPPERRHVRLRRPAIDRRDDAPRHRLGLAEERVLRVVARHR